ncbi:MAG: hypothetical protein F6K48_05410 [Okeania sp. SIO3H1]|uniref:hypothetical protein n=1 Tax=Okeania sp. SIO1I7 TaxID=2607772 RepID=UPI0013C68690|nr:hypothetical protein [Okeania sp. SIO1I7]NEN88386.1 hypothetical protein [Okeania sp. SIO3H1]NET24140.1 hypothetical protein [Okeania sp. SIO1I7]
MEKSAPPAARSPRRKDGARKLSHRFELVKAEYPEATVELWAMDEHRLGLKPIFRRVWTPVGVQATAEVNWRNQVVLALWSKYIPSQEQTNWWLRPLVNIIVFNQVLADECWTFW